MKTYHISNMTLEEIKNLGEEIIKEIEYLGSLGIRFYAVYESVVSSETQGVYKGVIDMYPSYMDALDVVNSLEYSVSGVVVFEVFGDKYVEVKRKIPNSFGYKSLCVVMSMKENLASIAREFFVVGDVTIRFHIE